MPTQNPKYRNRVVRFFRFGLDHLHFAIVQANLDLRNEKKILKSEEFTQIKISIY